MSARNFSFPKLKYQEIIICLKDHGIPVTLADLKSPTEATIRPIYEKLVENIMDNTKEEMRQPHFKAIDTLQNPELHEESLGEVLMARAILDLCKAAGVSNISMRDIYTPTPKMTKIVLSGLINFSKFRYERSATFEIFTQQTDEILQIGMGEEKENNELHEELQGLRATNEKNQPIITALEQETASLANEISEMNQQHNKLRKETRELKTSISETNDVIAADKLQLLQAQQEISRLKQQVVRSPEKIRQMLRSMNNAVESDKHEVAHVSGRLIALKSRHQALAKLKNKLEKRIATMRECEAHMGTAKKQSAELRETNQATEHNQRLTMQLVHEESHINEQINTAQRKLQSQTATYQQRKQAAQTALDKVLDEKNYLEEGINKENAQVSHNNAVLASKRAQLENLHSSHEAEKTEMLEKFQQLAVSLSSYHDQILQTMR